MKNKLMLVLAMVVVTISSNAQTIIGNQSADTLKFLTNDTTRMYLLPDGRVSINNGFNILGSNHAAVAIQKRYPSSGGTVPGSDQQGLLISDNASASATSSQLGIINYYSSNGIYVYSSRQSSSTLSKEQKGIVCEGGDVGLFRRIIAGGYSNKNYYGYINSTGYEIGFTSPGCTFTGFESNGNMQLDAATVIDFHASQFSGTLNTDRYGLKLDFTNNSTGKAKAAWGVYQTSDELKNHFNGMTLFGTTTAGNNDKVQVTGSTTTDGFATAIKTVTSNYTIANTDHTILVNAGSAVINLPNASSLDPTPNGKIFVIKKVSATSGTIDIAEPGCTTSIDNTYNCGTPYTISTQNSTVTVQYDAVNDNYNIIAEIVRP